MTEETTQQEVSVNHKRAVEFVGSHSMSDIIEHLQAQYDLVEQTANDLRTSRNEIYKMRDTVREFFTERIESSDDTVSLDLEDVNELLESINADTIEFTYKAKVTVTLFLSNIEANSEDDVEEIIRRGISVTVNEAEIDSEEIDVEDIESDNE